MEGAGAAEPDLLVDDLIRGRTLDRITREDVET
jgi:hypothetical protein